MAQAQPFDPIGFKQKIRQEWHDAARGWYEQNLREQTQKQLDAYLEHNPHHRELVKESWGLELLKQKANEYVAEHPDLGRAGILPEKLVEGFRAVGDRLDQELRWSRPAAAPAPEREYTAEDAFRDSLERYNRSRESTRNR